MPDISPGVQQLNPPTSPPQAQGLDALGLNIGGDPGAQQAYQALKRYIESLNPAGQQAALQYVQQQINQTEAPFGGGLGNPNALFTVGISNLTQMLRGLQSQIGPAGTQYNPTPEGLMAAPATAPGATPKPAASAGTSAPPATGTTGTTPLSASSLTETSGLTPQQYIDLMRLWGLQTQAEVDAMIKSFQDSYSVTYQLNQNADIVGGPGVTSLGTTTPDSSAFGTQTAPTTGQPSSPFAAFQQENTALGTAGVGSAPWAMTLQKNTGFGFGSAEEDRGTTGGQPPAQRLGTAQDVYAAVIGSSGAGGIAQRILTQYQEKYLNDTGQSMPADLVASLTEAVASLTPSQQQQWLEESIAKPGGSISIGSLDNVLNDYEAKHPTPSQTDLAEFNRVNSQMLSTLGRPATQADITALGPNPSNEQIQSYINSQPSPVKGFANYGAYNATYYNMLTKWQEYFGRAPSAQELAWGAGKTPEDLQSYINNSGSSVPGVTIGEKTDYQQFIDSLDTSGAGSTTHAFSSGIDDSMIKQLHDHLQSQSTGTATPGPLK